MSMMSWVTIYQLDSTAFDAQVPRMFNHTRAHSVVGLSSVVRMPLGLLSGTAIVRHVPLALCLNAVWVSLCFRGLRTAFPGRI